MTLLQRLHLVLAALGAVGCAAGPGSPDQAPPGAPATGQLTIASYNIKHGLGMDGVLDLDRIADVLAALDADVVLLQEVDERCGRSGGVDQAAALGARLGMDSRFAAFMDYDGGRYGLATLSRRPILASDVIALPPGKREPRAALRVTVDVAGEPVCIANAHLDWLSDDSERLEQARALLAALRAGPGGAMTVLGGDLNDVPESRTLALLTGDGGTGGGGLTRLGPTAPTIPSDAPERTIDHFLASGSGSWDLSEVRVIDEPVASDHCPVVATWQRTDAPPSTRR